MMAVNGFYVYVLFDAHAMPRYVGKGCRGRIESTVGLSKRNPLKNAFIRETMERLGEIPRVKVRDGLTEPDRMAGYRGGCSFLKRRWRCFEPSA